MHDKKFFALHSEINGTKKQEKEHEENDDGEEWRRRRRSLFRFSLVIHLKSFPNETEIEYCRVHSKMYTNTHTYR